MVCRGVSTPLDSPPVAGVTGSCPLVVGLGSGLTRAGLAFTVGLESEATDEDDELEDEFWA